MKLAEIFAIGVLASVIIFFIAMFFGLKALKVYDFETNDKWYHRVGVPCMYSSWIFAILSVISAFLKR